MTSNPVLPAQMVSYLLEAPGVATCDTGRAILFPGFIEQGTSNVQAMDAMYVVNWEHWFPKLLQRMHVSVMKPGG